MNSPPHLRRGLREEARTCAEGEFTKQSERKPRTLSRQQRFETDSRNSRGLHIPSLPARCVSHQLCNGQSKTRRSFCRGGFLCRQSRLCPRLWPDLILGCGCSRRCRRPQKARNKRGSCGLKSGKFQSYKLSEVFRWRRGFRFWHGCASFLLLFFISSLIGFLPPNHETK